MKVSTVFLIDEADAFDRLAHRCLEADLVLMNFMSRSPATVLEIGRNVRRVGGSAVPS